VYYKPWWVHFLLDCIFTNNHGRPTIRIGDQLPDAILFTVGVEWCALIIKYLKKWYFDDDIPKEKRSKIVIKSKPYILYNEKLHKLGPNNILHQCLSLLEGVRVLVDFHKGLAFWY